MQRSIKNEIYRNRNWTHAPGLKKTLQKKHGVATVTELTTARDPATAIGTDGRMGTHYKSVPAGYMVGTTGLGPCIGLIIVGPPDKAGNRPVWVYHFGPGDDPKATLNRDGPFPKGSHAVIAGGENGDRNSMGILSAVEQYMQANKANITVDGLYNSAGIWVDSNGNYFVHPRERSGAAPDGTSPTPAPSPDPYP